MRINNFFPFIILSVLLTGCGVNQTTKENTDYNYNPQAFGVPSNTDTDYMMYNYNSTQTPGNIAVLLPASGPTKGISTDIKTSIETAFLRKNNTNIKMSFYDLSGSTYEKEEIITNVLKTNPDIIIGPLFAEDAKMLRDMKPNNIPVISFTSDTKAIGNGVLSINLIPRQAIETIIHQLQTDDIKDIVILAPKNNSGEQMATFTTVAANFYDISVKGLYYYESGNTESIKNTAMESSLFQIRNAANIRAKEILSDILNKEVLTFEERASLEKQLERISRTETLGKVPYKAILFLGSGEDSKTLVSFLRYYGINNKDVNFYGTTLWQGSDILTDFTLSGARYVSLPEISHNFDSLYNMVAGKSPNYLSALGYDAANLSLGMIYTYKNKNDYLFNPNGYVGTCGIFRLKPNGESEHGLQIVELNATETPTVIKNAPENFLLPLYNIHSASYTNTPTKKISTNDINIKDYINIPTRFRNKSMYSTKNISTDTKQEYDETTQREIEIYQPTETDIVKNPEFESVKKESVSRKNIDTIEIEE